MPIGAPLLLALARLSGTANIDLATWERLQPPDPLVEALPEPIALARDVSLRAGPASTHFVATWTIRAFEPGWFHAVLAGPGTLVGTVTVAGEDAHIHAELEGYAVIAELPAGDTEIVLMGTVPTQNTVALDLLPASRGRIHIDVPASAKLPRGPDGAYWTGAEHIELSLLPPSPAPDRVVAAEVGLGVTAGDDVLRGAATVRVIPRRGSVDSIVLDTDALGADLAIEGPLRDFRRDGSRIVITLPGPASQEVSFRLAWTTPIPPSAEASLPLPSLRVDSVLSTRQFLRLARDGDREVVPSLPGWDGRSLGEMPEWTGSLVAGTPIGAWESSAPAPSRLDLLRFEPVDGPEAVVDVADLRLTFSDEGRALLRARYEVRSDRAAWMEVRPPAGAQLLACSLDGEAATPARRDGALLVPLKRSVEAVDGLLSFPVELAFLLEGAAWGRRVEQRVPIPLVDKDIAVLRATVVLPPGYRARGKPGRLGRVAAFSEGDDVLFTVATGKDGGEDETKSEEARKTFSDAVDAWKDNDWDGARDKLDELKDMGLDNRNMQRLEANLDALASDDREGAAARRVVEQAKARAKKDYAAYEATRGLAEQRARVGDWEAAAAATEEALAIGEKLGNVEQDEETEVAGRQRELLSLLSKAKEKAPARPAAAPSPEKFDFGVPEESISMSGYGSGGGGYGYGYGSSSLEIQGAIAKPIVATYVAALLPKLGDEVRFQGVLRPGGDDGGFVVRAVRARKV
jgi:hypothetical protein